MTPAMVSRVEGFQALNTIDKTAVSASPRIRHFLATMMTRRTSADKVRPSRPGSPR